MDTAKLRHLRKRQLLYLNLLFVIYGLILLALLLAKVTSSLFYLIFALVFFIAPIGYLTTKNAEPFLRLFPGMKELYDYEKEKLKEYWNKYQASTALLHTLAGVYLLIQAWSAENLPIIEGLPSWYFIVIPLLLLYIGNVNQLFHNKRIDQRPYEQLKGYVEDRLLFVKVFGGVALGMTVLGMLVIEILK